MPSLKLVEDIRRGGRPPSESALSRQGQTPTRGREDSTQSEASLLRNDKKYRAVLAFPVKNETLILGQSIKTAHAILEKVFPFPWLIIIAVNDSVDDTLFIAQRLAEELPNVKVKNLSIGGKGRAIREAWMNTGADYYFFSDIDLSVDLERALPLMIGELEKGADIAACSRALADSVVERPFYRRFISFGYRMLARLMTGTKLSDLPCGCKGVKARVVRELLPRVENNDWFFDSELLLLAEVGGYKIAEVTVHWVEYRYPNRIPKISLFKTIRQYLIALFKIYKAQHHD